MAVTKQPYENYTKTQLYVKWKDTQELTFNYWEGKDDFLRQLKMTKKKSENLLYIETKYSTHMFQHKTTLVQKNASVDKVKRTGELIVVLKKALDEIKVSNEEKYYAMKERMELGFERKVTKCVLVYFHLKMN